MPSNSGHVRVSSDGGRSFDSEKKDIEPLTGELQPTSFGYLSWRRDGPSKGQISLSYDGVGWRQIDIPIPE